MSPSKITASNELIRNINHSIVLDAVREQSPISRADIARRAGLSMSTTMRIVDELLEEKLVVPVGKGASTGGRPGSLVQFNYTGFAVVSIDLGGTKIYGVLSDLAGNISHSVCIPSNDPARQTGPYENLCQVIRELIDFPRPAEQKLLGIGIGAPGITDSKNGVVVLSPNLNWTNYPLGEKLNQKFNLPVYIENDVNLAALGEYGYGAGKGMKDIVLLALGTGVGAGIIIGGALYKGGAQSAGEAGYMIPGREFLKTKYKTGLGAVELFISGTGIVQRSHSLYRIKKQDLTAKDVFEAARAGEEWANNLVEDFIDYGTICVANIVSLLDPEIVIFSGGLMGSADILIKPIEEKLQEMIPFHSKLALSSLGAQATVLGATLYVLTAATGTHAIKQIL